MADTSRVVELITTLVANPSLRERLATASDSDRPAILAELGYPDLTPADVAANAAAFMPRVVDELNDDDLEMVAGGDQTADFWQSAGAASVAAAAAT